MLVNFFFYQISALVITMPRIDEEAHDLSPCSMLASSWVFLLVTSPVLCTVMLCINHARSMDLTVGLSLVQEEAQLQESIRHIQAGVVKKQKNHALPAPYPFDM